IYAIDVASGGLSGLSQLPHCGGVALADPEVTGRILDHVETAIRERRSRFEAVGAADLREHNHLAAGDDRLPWLLLLIDGWDLLHEEAQTTAGSALHDRILRLLADGQRFGVQGVVAGDRWVVSGKAGRMVAHRYVLRFNSDVDYDTTGLRASQVPEEMPSGRALGEGGRLHQVAVLGDGTGPGQAEALREMAAGLQAAAADVPPARRPRRVQSLPTKVMLDDLIAEAPPIAGKVPVLIGVSSASGGPLWVDLATEARGFVVAGARRSGRSTALLALAESARRAGVSVVALCPRPSPLRQLDGRPGVVAVYADDRAATAALAEVADLERVLVVADDIDQLEPSHLGLAALVAAPHAGRAIVVAATIEGAKNQVSGFLPALRRQRSGMLLCPTSVFDGGALGGGNLPRHLLFDQPEGRAVLSLGGDHGIVQVGFAGG
ncbi:MAG TPA: hypothetical protein VK507_09690, partial [Iamia sp.]|nr:hypothetical protein [Iamia sp.]